MLFRSDPRHSINTYIYDYFIQNRQYKLARAMLNSDIKPGLQADAAKQSPGSRNVNGVDAAAEDDETTLPKPDVPPGQCVLNSFLMDWWCQFWDIYSATRNRPTVNPNGKQYTNFARVICRPPPDTTTVHC